MKVTNFSHYELQHKRKSSPQIKPELKRRPDHQQHIKIPLRVNKQDQLQDQWFQVSIFDTPASFTIKAES